MQEREQKSNDYEVGAVRKALQILCEFTPQTPCWSLSELSGRLEIPKSTAHNLIRTLQGLGFLEQDPQAKRYRLGARVLGFSLTFSHHTQLVSYALPHLRDLADRTQETVKLGILSNREALITTAIESPYHLHTRGDEGRRAPLHSTSLGKALLSSLPDAEITEIAAHNGLPRFTARTIATLSRLKQEVEQIRAQGYAVDWEENESGVRCVAARVDFPGNRLVAAISVSGPASRVTRPRIKTLAPAVVQTSRAISASLAGRSPARPASEEERIEKES